MLSWLLVDLLVLFLDDGSNNRCGSVTIVIYPGSVRVLVPLKLLLSKHLNVLNWAWLDRQLVLVNSDMQESFSL